MDVLSEVLRAVHLEGALYFNGEFSAPWCVDTRSVDLAPYLTPMPAHVIIYHLVTEGKAYARLPGQPRVDLAAGDIVIFPHGDAHMMGNGSPLKPVDSLKTFAGNLTQGLKLARFGGGGEVTRFVCGYMACQPRLCEVVLAGLPRLLKVRITDHPSGKWLESSIRFAVAEGHPPQAGSSLVLARLAEVLFVETLRCYINSLPAEQTGWLAGARDAVIGQVLSLLHESPAHPWTVEELARRAGTSRSRLAERFRYFLNESPMAYLTRWRLNMAAGRLQSSDETVAAVAEGVGYQSETAFNRAFRKQFDVPPAQFRRMRQSVTATPG